MLATARPSCNITYGGELFNIWGRHDVTKFCTRGLLLKNTYENYFHDFVHGFVVITKPALTR